MQINLPTFIIAIVVKANLMANSVGPIVVSFAIIIVMLIILPNNTFHLLHHSSLPHHNILLPLQRHLLDFWCFSCSWLILRIYPYFDYTDEVHLIQHFQDWIRFEAKVAFEPFQALIFSFISLSITATLSIVLLLFFTLPISLIMPLFLLLPIFELLLFYHPN